MSLRSTCLRMHPLEDSEYEYSNRTATQAHRPSVITPRHRPILQLTVTDPATGKVWAITTVDAKQFSTGSVGFHANAASHQPGQPDAAYQATSC
jgi:hypothetical protein